MDEHTISPAGDPIQHAFLTRDEWREMADADPCPHCMDTGWVQMTAENDFGEPESYFVLCRRCAERGA